MDFRKVKVPSCKGFGDFSSYEISSDGSVVRLAATEAVVGQIDTGRTIGVSLLNEKGQAKVLGVPTLYRWAFNKPLDIVRPERIAAVKKEKKVPAEKIVKTPKVKGSKKIKSVLSVGKKDLLSPHTLGEVKERVAKRRALGSTGASVEVVEGKGNLVRVLFDNVEKDLGIVRVDANTWRNGYWFLNYNTGAFQQFSDELHRKDGLKGDDNLIWPTEI